MLRCIVICQGDDIPSYYPILIRHIHLEKVKVHFRVVNGKYFVAILDDKSPILFASIRSFLHTE